MRECREGDHGANRLKSEYRFEIKDRRSWLQALSRTGPEPQQTSGVRVGVEYCGLRSEDRGFGFGCCCLAKLVSGLRQNSRFVVGAHHTPLVFESSNLVEIQIAIKLIRKGFDFFCGDALVLLGGGNAT